MKAIILAGGSGKRLRPLTEKVPKILVKVMGKTLLEWILELLVENDVDEAILALGYKADKVIEFLKHLDKYNIDISYVVEPRKLGTGGALKYAMKLLGKEKYFYALNGDIITNMKITTLLEVLKEVESEGAIGVVAAVHPQCRYGILALSKLEFFADTPTRSISAFLEKATCEKYINAGIYCFTRDIIKYLPDKGDLERKTFPKLAKEGKIWAVPYKACYWYSIDTIKDIEKAEKELKRFFYG